MDLIFNAWRLLDSLSGWSFLGMFGMVLLTDAPRYSSGFRRQRPPSSSATTGHTAHSRRFPVSILLAGHNEEDAIEKCVRSLRQQTFNRFEIVCVDDGSSDKTLRSCDACRMKA